MSVLSTPWLIAAFVLCASLLPCLVVLLRDRLSDAMVAVQLAGTLASLAMLTLAFGLGNDSFIDLALCLAILTYPSALLTAHVFERWL